jgi:hypothetical protein
MRNIQINIGIALILLTSILGCGIFKKSPVVTNSFENHFQGSSTQYSYIDSLQTHDYSGNWDFDGDRIADRISFIGNGGAHLQFYLSIRLSTDNKEQSFDWLYNDFPLYKPYDRSFNDSTLSLPNFSIRDFTGDSHDDIYLDVGDHKSPLSPEMSNAGLHTSSVIISYDTLLKKFTFHDLKNL